MDSKSNVAMPSNLKRCDDTIKCLHPHDLSNTRPTLPAEIIDLIVDELGDAPNCPDSMRNLFSAALSSRRLCISAYRYLFAELHLTLADIFTGKDKGDSSAAVDLLRSLYDIITSGLAFPGLAMVYRLRTVWISIRYDCIDDVPLYLSLPYFVEVLRLLHGPSHGITSFKLETGRVDAGPDQWDLCPYLSERYLGSHFNAALHDLCHSRYLKNLHFKRIALSPSMLQGAHLEKIELQEVRIDDYIDDVLQHHLEDREQDLVVQPRSMTLICVMRVEELSEEEQKALDEYDFRHDIGVLDLVQFFHPNHTDFTLATQQVFTRLTELTLFDFDWNVIQLGLLPNLHSLRVIQRTLLNGLVPLGYSTLHKFFEWEPGVFRDLGTTKHLIVETSIHNSKMFLWRTFPESLNYFTYKDSQPARIAWRTVDSYALTSLFNDLESIKFVFKFYLGTNEDTQLPRGYDDASFLAANRRIILGFFPHVSSLSSFTLDVLVERAQPSKVSCIQINGLDIRRMSGKGCQDQNPCTKM